MDNCVRELTAKELIEQSNIDNKDRILSRLKEEDLRTHKQIERYETTISEQRYMLEAYRNVLADLVYSNWINHR